MNHGGMLGAARRLYPNARQPFLDLSTGINPVPYTPDLPADCFTRLPDADDLAALQSAAAASYGVPDPAMVVAAPGTQILISLLPHLLPRSSGTAAILSPTYGEHAAAWAAAGRLVRPVSTLAELVAADIAVVCNPNNPDGRRTGPSDLRAIARQKAESGGLLVVDEAFADLEPPGISLAGALPQPGLVVLRSFGKTYGLAGLRLGFLLCDAARAAALRTALGPWAVSGPALAAGLQALPDETWRAAAVRRLDQAVIRLDALLAPSGLAPIGGTRLFRLYEGPNATALCHRLGQAGILVRRFDGQPRHLRFGFPGSEPAWSRLAEALPAS